MIQVDKKERYLTIRIIMWLAVFVSTSYLTYKMSISFNDLYPSDYPAHISSALNDEGYSLMSIIMKVLYNITGNTVLIALFIGFLVAMTCEALLYLICQMNRVSLPAILISYALIYAASIYIPVVNPFWYMWVKEPTIINSLLTQSWHNSTYIAMRLFAICSLTVFLKCYKKIYNEESNNIRDLIILFGLLCITNMFKLNYVIAFVPALVVLCIIEILTKHGNGWREWIKLLISSLVSLFPLIIEYNILFPSDGEGGWKITLDKVDAYIRDNGSVFIVLTSLLFPIIITIAICINKYYGYLGRTVAFCWILEIITVAESMLLAETGVRASHGNFTWGVYCSSLILLAVCSGVLIKMIHEGKRGFLIELSVVSLALNLVNGFMYFGNIFKGQLYLC